MSDKIKIDLEKLAKNLNLDYRLSHYAKNRDQIIILSDIQNECIYAYHMKYLLAKREQSHEIKRERKQIIKSIALLKKYILEKHNDPVLKFMIDTIDQRLHLDNRISPSTYIKKTKDKIMKKLLSVHFNKSDIDKHLTPVFSSFIKKGLPNH